MSQNEKTSLVDALCCVIMHPIFRQYFHQNLQAYCKIISVSTSHVQDSADVLRLLKANSVLIKYATVDDDFSLYFMKTMFIPLVKIAAKFEHESDVFEEVLSSVQKVCHHRGFGSLYENNVFVSSVCSPKHIKI